MKRTRDLVSFHDEFCVECWEEYEGLQYSYLDREECFEENTVTEEEFDGLSITRSSRN